MSEAFICDAIRTPFGRYGGSLSGVRADDLGAIPIKALMERNVGVDWGAVDDVVYGCANRAASRHNVRNLELARKQVNNGSAATAVICHDRKTKARPDADALRTRTDRNSAGRAEGILDRAEIRIVSKAGQMAGAVECRKLRRDVQDRDAVAAIVTDNREWMV